MKLATESAAAQMPEEFVSGYRWTGKLYGVTRELSNKEIGKLIKKELSNAFPKYKFAVKTPNNSINVQIVDINYNPFSEQRQSDLLNNTNTLGFDTPRYNERYLKDLKKISSIREQYNYDDSDTQSDYFCVRYYGGVDLNEKNLINRLYPENIENNRINKMMEQWDANTKKRNEEAAKRRTGIKKGDKVTLTISRNWGCIPAGEYEATVYRAPNGRGFLDTFTVGISINTIIRKGVEVQLTKPTSFNDLKVSKNEIKAIA